MRKELFALKRQQKQVQISLWKCQQGIELNDTEKETTLTKLLSDASTRVEEHGVELSQIVSEFEQLRSRQAPLALTYAIIDSLMVRLLDTRVGLERVAAGIKGMALYGDN